MKTIASHFGGFDIMFSVVQVPLGEVGSVKPRIHLLTLIVLVLSCGLIMAANLVGRTGMSLDIVICDGLSLRPHEFNFEHIEYGYPLVFLRAPIAPGNYYLDQHGIRHYYVINRPRWQFIGLCVDLACWIAIILGSCYLVEKYHYGV